MTILSKRLQRRHEKVFETIVTFAPISENMRYLHIISDRTWFEEFKNRNATAHARNI